MLKRAVLFITLAIPFLTMQAQDGTFQSKTMPCRLLSGVSERSYGIYLPGGYLEDSLKKYPVLYLMHGGGGAHTDWETRNGLSHVANRLVQSGEIDDMVIVCPEGNARNMMYFNASEASDGAPDWKYEDYFFKELIPYIESTYRVRTDKGGRAIAGFSMGGGAASVYGVHHPEMFSMVYSISGYQRAQDLDFLKGDPSAPWRQRVIDENNPIIRIQNGTPQEVKAWQNVDWKISAGDRDFTLDANLDLFRAMKEKGIACALHTDDGDHDDRWVNPALEDVLKRAHRNFETLWISNGPRSIFGIISKPGYTGRKQPVAIVSHGFNGTHHWGRTYFETLNSLGYQVYAFDFPCGSLFSRSDNNTMNMSVMDEKSDLEAIVKYFREQPDVDPDGIVLIGESQGGFVTALASAEIPKEVKAVVLVFPAFCIPDDWNERYPKVADIPEVTRLWDVPLGRGFFLELRDINIFKTIKKYKGPVLIVQGDKDDIVLMEDSQKAVKIYRNARLHVIPGAGHGFKPQEQALNLERIKTFLTTWE